MEEEEEEEEEKFYKKKREEFRNVRQNQQPITNFIQQKKRKLTVCQHQQLSRAAQ